MPRYVNPTPELFIPGRWIKSSNKSAKVNISEHEFSAPLDMSPSSCAIRDHEYEHLVFSMPRENANKLYDYQNDMLFNAVSCLEDTKVNSLGTNRLGFDLAPAGDVNLDTWDENEKKLVSLNDKIRNGSALLAALLYASGQYYNDSHGYIQTAKEVLQKHGVFDKIDEIVKDVMNHDYFTANGEYDEQSAMHHTIESANKMLEILKDSNKQDIKKKNPSWSDKAAENCLTQTPNEALKILLDKMSDDMNNGKFGSNNGTPINMNSLMKNHMKKESQENVPWGTMDIKKYPMKAVSRVSRIKTRPTKKASQFGATFRYVHRLLTDRGVFATPRRSTIGTILLDRSGSMSLNDEDIVKMLVHSPGATIACYSGGSVDGHLQILAVKGKSVADLPNRYGGNNIVDVPAMEWLLQQEAPRYWVCDGYCTGIHNKMSPVVTTKMRQLVKKGNIIQVTSLTEFLDLLKTGKIKHLKPRNHTIHDDW